MKWFSLVERENEAMVLSLGDEKNTSQMDDHMVVMVVMVEILSLGQQLTKLRLSVTDMRKSYGLSKEKEVQLRKCMEKPQKILFSKFLLEPLSQISKMAKLSLTLLFQVKNFFFAEVEDDDLGTLTSLLLLVKRQILPNSETHEKKKK